jgi:hypothetical protein
MIQTLDIQKNIAYIVADTGLNKVGLFARVSAGNLSCKIIGGCEKYVSSRRFALFTNDF